MGRIHPCAETCTKRAARVKSVVIESVGMASPAWDLEDDIVRYVLAPATGIDTYTVD
jgi:hypothetical protein